MRIRTIKPEFFTHEGLFDAEQASKLPLRISFAGLWCAADREGRFKWEPRRLGVQILPYDKLDFANILSALEAAGFIVRYGNGQFGWIPSFLSHQCVNIREAKSKIPSPDEFLTESHVQDDAPTFNYNGVNIQPKLREYIFKRDGHKCQRCDAASDLTVDHIFPQSSGGTHCHKNLRTLCRSCNSARPVQGKALIDDLALDGLTFDDMPSMCTHVQARGEGKGREQEGKGKDTPLPPRGNRRRMSEAEKRRTKVDANTPQMVKIGAWFGRKPETLWTLAESEALNQISPTDKEIDGMATYYDDLIPPEKDYRRRDLQTLLNNWPTELDRARQHYKAKHP